MKWTITKLRLVSPFLMWAIVIAGVLVAVLCLPDRAILPKTPYTKALLVLAAINWLHFFAGGVKANKRAPQSAAAVDRVVTTRVYAKVRHPIYSADIFLAWGLFLCFPTLRIAVSVAWLTIVLLCWLRLEEAALLHKFGEDYILYRANTPMLFPKYFRRHLDL